MKLVQDVFHQDAASAEKTTPLVSVELEKELIRVKFPKLKVTFEQMTEAESRALADYLRASDEIVNIGNLIKKFYPDRVEAVARALDKCSEEILFS